MAIKISGTTVIDDNKVSTPNNTAEARTAPTISAGVLTLDLNASAVFDVTLNAAITSIVIQNVQSVGKVSSFVLNMAANGTAYSIAWPASFKWPDGIPPTPTVTNGKDDVYVFFTTDGGTSWQAFVSGQNL